jgi:YidC/Oxa1 family membrane protein insertase
MNPQNDPDYTKNLLIAALLSMAVLVFWWWAFPMPAPKPAEPQTAQQGQAQTPAAQAPAPELAREAALAQSGRIRFHNDTEDNGADAIDGTIALTGARIDDLRLLSYNERLNDPASKIVLLNPWDTKTGYAADFGWRADPATPAELPSTSSVWQVVEGGELTPQSPLTLRFDNGQGVVITRRFEIDNDYLITVRDTVENKTANALKLTPFARVARRGLPKTSNIWVVFEGLFGVFGGTLHEVHYTDLTDDERTKTETSDAGGWIGFSDHYWMTAVAADQTKPVEGTFHYEDANGMQAFVVQVANRDAAEIAPGGSAESKHYFFGGAKKMQIVDRYAESPGLQRFDLTIDWGWFFFLTKPFFIVLEFFFGIVGNFGVAILMLTLAIKALFFPLANRSYEMTTKMKKIQPEMMALRERYKDDMQRQQQEMMALYKREKVNPVSGCLPLLLQIPVFFALYKVLYVTIDMRHAPFFGWVQDLSAPDPTSIFNLFGLLPYAVPAFLILGVWPILNGFVMWLQMKMNPPAPDPVQQRIFSIMPWMFMVMLAHFPVGLVIYWAWNGLLSVAQQYVIMRRMGVEVHLFDNMKTAWPFSLFFGKPRGAAGE